ncbi:nitrous oxide-stimulated promoter family protein [Bacillus rubiinfantis]|uniref:nitrous oxide-stimulated promoter family protein n=1 Tax=Bacillus rubiinfantis TaxID=1499680 RepID=UPI0005AB5243|nr:nitrous oxide-stimulated promoter family protein [Bacillus rubiinfantis]
MGARVIQPNVGPNIQKEKEIVKEMIELYCRKKHHRDTLCKECLDLKNYAFLRLSFCRFGEDKTACSNCTVHCYKQVYREKMKVVMRYSGPWMLLYHPIYSVKHLLNR